MVSFRQFAKFTPALSLLAMVFAAMSAPTAAAQTTTTPTPQPAIEATRQAAQAQLDAANRDIEEAARRDEQAEEMRRNAEAQQASAAANLQAAEVAIAVRDTAASAEALGRARSDLSALSASVDGLTRLNDTANDTVRLQAAQIASMTLEVQALRTDKAIIANAYAATVKRAETAEQTQAQGTSPVAWIVIMFLIACCAVWFISRQPRKQNIPPAAPVAYDVGRYDSDEVIEG